jgi:ribosome-associated translation inhibitor RaiA
MTNCEVGEDFEISSRFRHTVEEQIARLEKNAEIDEAQVALLEDDDHIRRQMRLVALQRAEALRMRLILDRANTAGPAR